MMCGCGYVGGPLTPLANVPTAVTDLSAVQRGDTIVARFTVPYRTTEGQPIKGPVKLDLRVGPASENFHADEWASQAKAAANPTLITGIAIYRIPAAEWAGKEVVIGVRATGPNGKESGWSNYEVLRVVPTPETPSKPVVEPVPVGMHVTWTGRGDQFRILRSTGNDENFVVQQTLPGHEWTDNDVESGKIYNYKMQALVNAGNQKVAESNFSAVTSQNWVDKFAPAVPSGLRVDPAGNSVALVWEADTEPDLAGYRIYRSEGGGPWTKLADTNGIPSYSDATIEHGKTYRYAVSAFDKSSNESERSAPVEIVP